MAPNTLISVPGRNGSSVGQQERKSTSVSSASGSSAGRGTLDQQRDFGSVSFPENTAAYTHDGVAATFGLEPQRPSANKFPAYPTTIGRHDLQSAGLHPVNASTIQHGPRVAYVEGALACPYHGPILQGHSKNAQSGQGLNPMDRYVAEGPSERYAVLPRPDARTGPMHTGCRCLELMQSHHDANNRAKK